jgi:hypothetical protein
MQTIIEDRLNSLPAVLLHGSHAKNCGKQMCIMEAAAWVAGEPWSDHPECVCPVIGAFMRSWNDGISDDVERTRLLKPFVPLIINTKGTAELETRRATMAADWLVRTHAPAWLRLAGLAEQADALSSLPEITDFANCPSLKAPLKAARKDAAAAWDAAWDAARDAAIKRQNQRLTAMVSSLLKGEQP